MHVKAKLQNILGKNGQICKKQKSHNILVVSSPSAITERMNRRKEYGKERLDPHYLPKWRATSVSSTQQQDTHSFVHKMLARTIFLPLKMSQNLKIQCIWTILSDYNGTELDLMTEEPKYLESTVLSNLWIKELGVGEQLESILNWIKIKVQHFKICGIGPKQNKGENTYIKKKNG